VSAVLPDPVRTMLEEASIVRVATVTLSGAPHVAPFWFAFDGERIVLDTLENHTVANVRHDDRVSVAVDLGERFDELREATIAGRARVFRPEKAPSAVVTGVEAVRAEHAAEIATPFFEDYAQRETRHSVYVEITPVSAQWWSPREKLEFERSSK
jgi:nitroimidazol reductase NimA-like FMN-containing flavoprotein (pyridoxamine 5'-phosphate oxidase superfamily)